MLVTFTNNSAKEHLGNEADLEDIAKWTRIANAVASLCEKGKIHPQEGVSIENHAIEVATSSIIKEDKNKQKGNIRIHETVALSMEGAEFDEENKTATVRIIQGDNGVDHDGWSLNNVYYSAEIMKQLVPFLETSKKMYIDHQSLEDKGNGRSLNDWAATVLEAWELDASVYAKISIQDNHNKWIYEAMKNTPEEVGVSIDAYVEAKKGKMHDREGIIVSKWVWLNSSDFVTEAAAKGGTVSVDESINVKPELLDALYSVVEDYYREDSGLENSDEIKQIFEADFKKRFEKSMEKGRFYNAWETAMYISMDIVNQDDSSIEDKRKSLTEIIDLMKSYILELNPEDLTYGMENLSTKNNKDGENILEIKDLKDVTLDQLVQAGNTEVFESAKSKVREETEKEMTSIKEENISLKKEVEERDTKIAEFETAVAESKEKDRVNENVKTITAYLTENKIESTKMLPGYVDSISTQESGELTKSLASLKEHFDKIKEAEETENTATNATEGNKSDADSKDITVAEVREGLKNAI